MLLAKQRISAPELTPNDQRRTCRLRPGLRRDCIKSNFYCLPGRAGRTPIILAKRPFRSLQQYRNGHGPLFNNLNKLTDELIQFGLLLLLVKARILRHNRTVCVQYIVYDLGIFYGRIVRLQM